MTGKAKLRRAKARRQKYALKTAARRRHKNKAQPMTSVYHRVDNPSLKAKPVPTFKDRYLDFQRLVGEYYKVRKHNMGFTRDSLDLLHFSEGALIMIALERYLRMVMIDHVEPKDTLYNLLQKGTGKQLELFVLPGEASRDETIKRIMLIRNAFLHGNFEMAARENSLPNAVSYFSSRKYIQDVEWMFRVLNRVISQFDEQGQPHPRHELEWYLRSPDFRDLSQPNDTELRLHSRGVLYLPVSG